FPAVEEKASAYLKRIEPLLEGLLAEKLTDPTRREKLALVLCRVGKLLARTWAPTSKVGAIGAFRRASEELRALVELEPEEPRCHRGRGRCENEWGDFLRETSPEDASPHFDLALAHLRPLPKTNPEYQRALAEALNSHGLFLHEKGDYVQAFDCHQEGKTIL